MIPAVQDPEHRVIVSSYDNGGIARADSRIKPSKGAMFGGKWRRDEAGQTLERPTHLGSGTFVAPPIFSEFLVTVVLSREPNILRDIREVFLLRCDLRFLHVRATIDDPLSRPSASQAHPIHPGLKNVKFGAPGWIRGKPQPRPRQIARASPFAHRSSLATLSLPETTMRSKKSANSTLRSRPMLPAPRHRHQATPLTELGRDNRHGVDAGDRTNQRSAYARLQNRLCVGQIKSPAVPPLAVSSSRILHRPPRSCMRNPLMRNGHS